MWVKASSWAKRVGARMDTLARGTRRAAGGEAAPRNGPRHLCRGDARPLSRGIAGWARVRRRFPQAERAEGGRWVGTRRPHATGLGDDASRGSLAQTAKASAEVGNGVDAATATDAERAAGEEVAGNLRTGAALGASQETKTLNWDLEEVPIKEGLGFGFSAGGLLFPYFVGNAAALKRLGLVKQDTVVTGASAGSLIGSFLVCDVDLQQLMDASLEMYEELREKGTVGNVRGVLETQLRRVLPADAHLRANGRLHVAIVRVNKQRPFVQPVFVNTFYSKEDLIQALLTSSHVPLYMNRKVTQMFRGRRCVDGGISNFIPTPPCTEPVKVCCFPQVPFASDIAPGNFGPCPFSLREMLRYAILPPSEEKIGELFEMGVNDVLAWAKARRENEDGGGGGNGNGNVK